MKTLVKMLILSVLFLSACEKVKTKKTYYPDKTLKEKWDFTNENGEELKNGIYESWYKNGKKEHVFNYVDGKKHGAQKFFYKDGKMKRKEQYMFGILTGKVKNWDKQGNVLTEVVYTDGKKNGIYKSYHPSGNLHKKISYLNDEKNGLQIEYGEDKSFISASWFKDGKHAESPADSAEIIVKTIKRDTTSIAGPKKDKEADEEETPQEE